MQTWQNVEGYHRKGPSGDPSGGPLPWGVPLGARPTNGRGIVLVGLGYGRAPWPSSPAGELGAPSGGVGSSFSLCVLWFSGLFSKHRSRIDTILEPLRSYLRYGHNGPCFVGFRDRLVIQTWRNVEGYHRKGPSVDPAGGPLP